MTLSLTTTIWGLLLIWLIYQIVKSVREIRRVNRNIRELQLAHQKEIEKELEQLSKLHPPQRRKANNNST